MASLEIYEGSKYYPAIVALEVTLRCNMRCMHCGSYAEGGPRAEELSLDEWKRVVDQLVALNAEYFTLSGGEPFVSPHWKEVCQHIRSHGKTLAIISNGYRIQPDDIRYLQEIGMWNIALSVDGLAATHEKIRGISGCFERVTQAIRAFKQAGIKVCISTSVNRLNIGELEPLKLYLAQLGVNLWQVQVVNSFGRAGEQRDQLILSPRQYVELLEFIHRSQQEQKSGRFQMNILPADSVGYCQGLAKEIWGELEWSGCNAGRYVIGIQSNGDVVGCLSMQHSMFKAGNVRKRSLADIWNDDDAFAYNRKFDAAKLNGPCTRCEHGDACRSGCLAMGYSVSGTLYNNPYCFKYIKEAGLDR